MSRNADPLDVIEEALTKLGCWNPHTGAGWEIRRLREYRDGLFNLAPFKAGDRVRLREGWTMPSGSPGWHGCEIDLFPGSTGEVHSVDYWPKKGFVCHVIFDSERARRAELAKSGRYAGHDHTFGLRADSLEPADQSGAVKCV